MEIVFDFPCSMCYNNPHGKEDKDSKSYEGL